MKIHEYQGKELLKRFGVPVPRGFVARSVEEAHRAAGELGTPVVVVKAQIHAGGRGKGGGVKLAKTPAEAKEIAAKLRARPSSLWPAGMPPAALRVLQSADEVEAILAAASVDEPGGALSASAAAARRDALRPLETAVRVARRAAVTEAVRVLAASPLV